MILTIEEIKTNSRIDADDEDQYLLMLAETAETMVESAIGRTWDEVVARWGCIPPPLRHACLMLADHLYEHRGATAGTSCVPIPYGVSAMVRPYTKIAKP